MMCGVEIRALKQAVKEILNDFPPILCLSFQRKSLRKK